MARVKQVFKASDHPGRSDEGTRRAVDELFEHMFPGQPDAEIPGNHAAFATVAKDPRLALRIIKLSDYIVREMPWTSQRADLREVAIQALSLHFKSDYLFQSHIRPAQRLGISVEQQALLPFWRTTNAFNDEQRLVIEYTLAVVSGNVPDELFSRVVKQFGEQGAVEFTVGVAWWSFWAMIVNATGTDFDYGYGRPAAQS